MIIMSGASDKPVFDGNTILPKIKGENDKHRYVYIDEDMTCSFLINDNIYDYISNMGNNLCKHSLNFSQCYKYRYAIRRQN